MEIYKHAKAAEAPSELAIPDISNDLCFARAEKRPYRDNSGNFIAATTYKLSHYHTQLSHVCAAEPSLVPYGLNIPPDVSEQLTHEYKYVIWMQLGLQL